MTLLSSDGYESAYRQDVEQLAVWCSHNKPELNEQLCGWWIYGWHYLKDFISL